MKIKLFLVLYLSFNSIIHAQTWDFVGAISADQSDKCITVKTDLAGNIIVSGYVGSDLPDFNFGNNIIVPNIHPGGKEMFVAKYTSSGICTWAKAFGQNYDDRLLGMDVDMNGVFVSNADETQSHPKNIPDGKGGSIYAWQDKREGQYDIYAHHLNAFGLFVGLNDLQSSNFEFAIYPNPCQNLLTIESHTLIQSFSIINSIGSCVYNSSVPTTTKQCVDLTYLPSGIYLIQVNTLLESSMQLLIKQ